MYRKYNGKIIDKILYILIHSSFCINFHAAHMQLKFCQTCPARSAVR